MTCKRHVEAIREKYIRPFDGTFDFALMYVPAEAVYCEIASDDDGGSLADYATERRVIPVSPRLLYTYLATVAMGLRGMELQKSAQQHPGAAVRARDGSGTRVEVPFQTLGTHIRNAQKQVRGDVPGALERFGGRLDGIARQGDTEIAEGESGGSPSCRLRPDRAVADGPAREGRNASRARIPRSFAERRCPSK